MSHEMFLEHFWKVDDNGEDKQVNTKFIRLKEEGGKSALENKRERQHSTLLKFHRLTIFR